MNYIFLLCENSLMVTCFTCISSETFGKCGNFINAYMQDWSCSFSFIWKFHCGKCYLNLLWTAFWCIMTSQIILCLLLGFNMFFFLSESQSSTWQASFNLPKLDVKFVHREHNLSLENNIMGIQLRCSKSHWSEDVVESTRLDIHMDFSEIHVWQQNIILSLWITCFPTFLPSCLIFQLLRESSTSILEILKVDVDSSVYLSVEVSNYELSAISLNPFIKQFLYIMYNLVAKELVTETPLLWFGGLSLVSTRCGLESISSRLV